MRAMSAESVDCGRTEPGADNRKAVLNCVRSHLRTGAPFRVRFDGTCIDTVCAWGVFRDSSGALRILSYDPKGCSSTNDADVWCGTFGEVPCRQPQVTIDGEKVRVSCKGYEF